MASETTVPDQSANEQHAEQKKVNGSVENVEQETVSQSKDVVDDSEKPKMEEPATTKAVVTEPEEKTEYKDVTTPPVVDVETIEEANKTPTADVPVETDSAVVENSDRTPVICAVPKTPIEVEQSELSDVPEPSIEAVVDKPVENSEAAAVTEAKIQVAKEPGEVSEPAAVVETPADHSESCAVPEAKDDPKEQSVLEVEGNAEEKSTASDVTELASEVAAEEENKSESLVAKESVESEVLKDEVTLADNTEVDDDSLKKKQSVKENTIADSDKIKVETCGDQEVVATQISDAEVPATLEVPADEGIVGSAEINELGEAGEKSIGPDVIGTVERDSNVSKNIDNVKKEGSENVVEESRKEAAEEVACGIAEKSVETEVNVEKEKEDANVKTDEPSPTEATKTEVNGSIPASEVTDSVFEREKTTRDVEMVTEEKKERVENDDVATLEESSKDREVEVGKDIVDTPPIAESVVKSSELELEAKVEEPTQTNVTKLEKEEEKNVKVGKSDTSNLAESTKQINDAKTDGDVAQQEVPTKKHSTSIMSKVKQSMVKVKKAIIGKSPSSKTISVSVDAKDEIKVK